LTASRSSVSTARHVGVGVQPRPTFEALALYLAGLFHPRADLGARLFGSGPDQVAVGHRRHLEMDVDSVQQRPGHS
jgi:hypothetical protein